MFKNDVASLLPLRHLQREIEKQKALANHCQQQMKKLDEDVKQNQVLLRRADQEQKTTKVTHWPLSHTHRQTGFFNPHFRWIAYKSVFGKFKSLLKLNGRKATQTWGKHLAVRQQCLLLHDSATAVTCFWITLPQHGHFSQPKQE